MSSRPGVAIGGHQSARMMSDTWLTPPEIIAALGRFDLDPCAAPEPRPWPTADRHLVLADDGLTADWTGRVWLNPPYSREARKWVARLADHGHGTALVFARTETDWFVESVWRRASLLLFLAGRVHFHRADGTRARDNSGAPSVLAAYGDEDAKRLADSGLTGAFATWWLGDPPAAQGHGFGPWHSRPDIATALQVSAVAALVRADEGTTER